MLPNRRVKRFKSYLEEERAKIEPLTGVWNASSDIIESVFGTYKDKKNKDSLSGITSYVLLIPLLTKVGVDGKPSGVNFKQALWNKEKK
jgi:hypothetical protein